MRFILILILFYDISNGQTPEPFQPEIIKQFPNVRDLALSNKGDEIFFTLQSHNREFSTLISLRKIDGKWQDPLIASFSGHFQDMEPFFSKDDLRLYFASNRPAGEDDEPKDFDIWYVERQKPGGVWSAPVNLGQPVNTEHNEFYPSLADNGNLYFTSDPPNSKGKDDIYMSVYKKGLYSAPFSVSDSINTAGYEFNAYIAPDESFIIYTGYNYPDGYGSGDLYISHNRHGKWTGPQNLGENVNSDQMDFCPYVDRKGRMLYFTSRRSSVKTLFKERPGLDQLLEEMNKYDNGQSRIYKAPLINKP
jgi:hypothetical protein